MILKSLQVTGFRNLAEQNIILDNGINILHGENAQGETNFIEAIYFLSMGRSHRTDNIKELVFFNKKEARLRGIIERKSSTYKVDSGIEIFGNKNKRYAAIDHVPLQNTKDHFGVVLVVLFSPEDLRLVKSGPEMRRRFMDMEMCQLSKTYLKVLKDYYRILRQRNHLLKLMQKGKHDNDLLAVYDNQLATSGLIIMGKREIFIKKINDIASEIHSFITDGKEKLQLIYAPNIKYDYEKILQKTLQRDISLGSTSMGIHKDDLIFEIGNCSARRFGSQGQQRTAALSAKLAEAELINELTGTWPVLLLDDVLSELDKSRHTYLLKKIANMQTILTCTDITGLDNVKIFEVKDGVVSDLQ